MKILDEKDCLCQFQYFEKFCKETNTLHLRCWKRFCFFLSIYQISKNMYISFLTLLFSTFEVHSKFLLHISIFTHTAGYTKKLLQRFPIATQSFYFCAYIGNIQHRENGRTELKLVFWGNQKRIVNRRGKFTLKTYGQAYNLS